ncbi:MAG TPA: ATP-binding protein, partial [Pyrinomonadaceae bacterium]|nr:ATP-binding protein [Pyrinomonadaceae bacterium]
MRWISSVGQFRFEDNGQALEMYGVDMDVTDIKQAERELRENQSHLKLTTEAAGIGTWQWNLQTNELVWSSLHKQIWGYESELDALTYESWSNPIHPDDLQMLENEIQIALRDNSIYDVEYRIFPVNGSPQRWIRSTGQFTFDDNGEPYQLSGISLDITDRKQTEEALIKAERRAVEEYQTLLSRIVPLAQVIGTAPDLITIYRQIADFVRASMPCVGFFVSFYDSANELRIAAYGWAEGMEIDIESLPPMPLKEGANTRAIRSGQTIVVDQYPKTAANKHHIIIGDKNSPPPESALVVPMIVMGRTIGTLEAQAYESAAYSREHIVALEMVASLAAVAIENVRLLETQAAARRDAEFANRSKDEFLAVLSHELRTPLNSMFGWVRMLSTGQLDAEKTKRAVEVIERNINLQTKLIEDILDVSRIISGKIQLDAKQLDFKPLVTSVVDQTRPTAETKDVRIETVFNSEACILTGDADRLQQIVGNLLSNAVKFTSSGGRISVSLDCNENWAELEIKDSGVGINAEFLPYVFDRFRQADGSSKRKHGGLGLGLAIVKHLSEMHGGQVRVESEGEGKGSAFYVRLPMNSLKVNPDIEDSDYPAPGNGNSAQNLTGIRLLIVDDDTDALEMLKTMFGACGAIATTLDSAAE